MIYIKTKLKYGKNIFEPNPILVILCDKTGPIFLNGLDPGPDNL